MAMNQIYIMVFHINLFLVLAFSIDAMGLAVVKKTGQVKKGDVTYAP